MFRRTPLGNTSTFERIFHIYVVPPKKEKVPLCSSTHIFLFIETFMFSLGCLKFIKHSLQKSRQLLDEMKESRLFWVQMMSCCSTIKVSGTQWEIVWLVTLWDVLSQAMGDCWLIPGFLAPSNGEFDARGVPCYSPRAPEQDRIRGKVGFAPRVPHEAWPGADRTPSCPWRRCTVRAQCAEQWLNTEGIVPPSSHISYGFCVLFKASPM